MQHYLSCGIGINTSNISKEDWNMLADIPNIDEAINLDTSSNDFSFTIVPSTEDAFTISDCHCWSSIILKDIKSVENNVKTISFSSLHKIDKAYFPLNNKNKEDILNILKQYKLEKYIDFVEPLVYSYCC